MYQKDWMMSKTYNLFLSHSWSYSDAYEKLISLLNKRPYFSYKNFSVPKDDPIHNAPNSEELYDAIKRKISPCHTIVILAGVYSSYSKWIEKEIRISNREFSTPKPIIGVKPWGNTNVSRIVSDNADLIVGWNSESIISAIRELS